MLDRGIVARLQALGRQLRLHLLVDGLAVVSLATVGAILITLLIDHTFWLARDMRVTQLATLLILLAVVAWRWVINPLRVKASMQDLALLVERRYPQMESALVTAVELAAQPHDGGTLARSVIEQAERTCGELPFHRALSGTRFRQRGAISLGCLALIGVIAVSAGSTMRIWFERNVLLRDAVWPQHSLLEIDLPEGGAFVVPRGDDLTISARVVDGYLPPRQAFISFETTDGVSGREQMPAIQGEIVRFEHTFERIQQTLQCRITGGDATPFEFRIEVVPRPRVKSITLAVTAPAYTDLGRVELRRDQTVLEALPGSEIDIHIETNKPVTDALLMRANEESPETAGSIERISAQSFHARCRPEQTGTYHFLLTDENGLTNVSERVPPVRFSVRIVPDKPPKVTLRVKGAGDMITREAVLPIETDFSDQFGLATATLRHQTSRENTSPVDEPFNGFEKGTKTFAREIDWPIAPRAVREGDRLTVQALATDTDDVAGPNMGESQPMVFRVVSKDELLAELSRREQEYRQDFERVIRLQEELYAEMLSMIERTDWADRERTQSIRRLSRRQRDQAGRLITLRVQFEQVLSELRINRLADDASEERLGNQIVGPLEEIGRSLMPAAATALDVLAEDAEQLLPARQGQDAVLEAMNTVLRNMLKWERFQEAVTLLRDVMKMQGNLNRETEKKLETEIFGIETQPGASNP